MRERVADGMDCPCPRATPRGAHPIDRGPRASSRYDDAAMAVSRNVEVFLYDDHPAHSL
jgi:hypothetical protein